MKKLIYLLLSVALFACTDNIYQSGKTINIRPAQGAWNAGAQKAKATTGHLSALEIVKQADIMRLIIGTSVGDVGFASKDTITPCLKRYGTDIISSDGKLVPDFLEATDCVIERFYDSGTPKFRRDTIAYIPNSVIRAAEIEIKAAYDKKEYDTVYRLFETAFTFQPITGAEWRELKKLNQQ